jgi:hypothetical protein
VRAINERDLAVVIPLLAARIRELTLELLATDARGGALADEEVEERARAQEMLAQHDHVLDSLRSEYEAGLAEGIRLPTFDQLTRRFRIAPAQARQVGDDQAMRQEVRGHALPEGPDATGRRVRSGGRSVTAAVPSHPPQRAQSAACRNRSKYAAISSGNA